MSMVQSVKQHQVRMELAELSTEEEVTVAISRLKFGKVGVEEWYPTRDGEECWSRVDKIHA